MPAFHRADRREALLGIEFIVLDHVFEEARVLDDTERAVAPDTGGSADHCDRVDRGDGPQPDRCTLEDRQLDLRLQVIAIDVAVAPGPLASAIILSSLTSLSDFGNRNWAPLRRAQDKAAPSPLKPPRPQGKAKGS